MITKVSRNYLEIKSIGELNYSKSPNNKCELFEINPPDFQINKIWLHTCSLDHENALKNYLSRGMKIFKSETINLDIN